MTEPFRIGIAGIGTVGAGLVKLIQANGERLCARSGRRIEIAAVSARNRNKDRGVSLDGVDWADKPEDLTERKDLDAVVELIGGEEGPALNLTKKALRNGLPVITANKAMLAHHGLELATLAEDNNAALMYEAAVAGAIPAIKTLREGLAGNRIEAVYGILNGTCNYILSEMRASGRDFQDVLKEAQDLGYAEADPALDVDGFDAAHKLTLLTSLAFGVKPDYASLRVYGVRQVTQADIAFADELGYAIRLLGIARMIDEEGKSRLVQRLKPCLVPKHSTLGMVEGVFNAVELKGDQAGESISIGRGAGAGPTASAVASDIVDLARGAHRPCFGVPVSELKDAEHADSATLSGRFYIRLSVVDKSGVLAEVAGILRDNHISIEAMLQRGRDPLQSVPLVLITHEASQSDIFEACEQISSLSSVLESPCVMHIEELEGE